MMMMMMMMMKNREVCEPFGDVVEVYVFAVAVVDFRFYFILLILHRVTLSDFTFVPLFVCAARIVFFFPTRIIFG
ncbi:hypothetical protein HanRHA438_Chr14g0665751 [Helianthus annuus]|uniref:Transmembrane protein n=1 Tax=Helianthus annuus TaxID=4232 RepID=A0A9K3EAK6_HELAN|nr:hypothetical protein HanXRQr2_Chr14g0654941 [Helianthus annuus]KAJ0464979.1 hypothetical protein HanHA300_Chr14g0533341 [Helianthus annuus]KAJ0486572.1 hypothetical protein HanHA89_Chr14g0581161 [Helianthus annuus]KAJ0657138.1 hypothetical protein HanLR1_Chr14g0543741 [Helianthus annuus]KAJ0660715.1 hypothetical protein HanOQP8_Chr14g0540841 [Helianthus annuus]